MWVGGEALSHLIFSEGYHLEVVNPALIDIDSHEGALALPSLIAGCAGIDMQQAQFGVGHDLKDM